MPKKKREKMTAAEKRAETDEVRKFLKDQTGSAGGRPGAANEFLDLLKKVVGPKKK